MNQRRILALRRISLAVSAAAVLLAPGCAAMTNPVADGITARQTAPDLLQTCYRDKEESIPLALLQHPPADTYRLDTGDVLGVWIDGILADRSVPIPVHTVQIPGLRDQRATPPSAGYPFTVREDGTLRLPLVDPIQVRGMSLTETEDAIKQAYVKKEIVPPGRERLLVTLLQKRQYEVVVLRQEATSFGVGAEGGFTTAGKRNTGFVINLTAYENDVLHALSVTGGLPGLDAYNQVIIYRRPPANCPDRQELLRKLSNLAPGELVPPELAGSGPMVRIPLRQDMHLPLAFKPEDVVLQTGDVVYLEARDKDVYYTAGLLPAGEHILPRDRDLDVLTAVSLVRGPLVNGTFGANTLNGAVFPPGLGQPSASLLTVVRKTAGGGQLPIRIDLNRALRDPRERILVRAGDLLILQERPTEAFTRWASQTFINFNMIWAPIHGPHEIGALDIMGADRIPGRGVYSTFTPSP
jgi:protein involved in polysaccharide export with SLBB domain